MPALSSRIRLTCLASSRQQIQGILDLFRTLGGVKQDEEKDFVYIGDDILEVRELAPVVGLARGLWKRPPLARLAGISVFHQDESSSSPAAAIYGDFNWASEDRPVVVPMLSATPLSSSLSSQLISSGPSSSGRSRSSSLLGLKLKEIVISMGTDASHYHNFASTLNQVGLLQDGLPNVWNIGHGSQKVAFRLLPSILSSIIFSVESLQAAKEELVRKEICFEHIGYNGANSQGQVILSTPYLDGLDIRLSDQADAITSFFCEGEEVLKEGVLDDVNPALARAREAERAGGGGSNRTGIIQYRNLESDGDCWKEFRATLRPRNLKGWFK